MKINYKKVGDTLPLAEYNALCYLLTHNKWEETVNIEYNTVLEGKYASYSLEDPFELLSETREGYVFVKNIESLPPNQRLLYFNIDHEHLNAHFEIILEAIHKTHIKELLSNESMNYTIQKEDFKDDTGSEEERRVMYNNSDIAPTSETITISLSSDADESGTISIAFDPVAYNLKKGDFIQNNYKISLSYIYPEINYSNGSVSEDDEIIVETFEELKNVIETAPVNSTTKIRLLGINYDFGDQIEIKDKSIIIRGGNIERLTNEPFTTLDAYNTSRHFVVTRTGSLSINNCKLINGNVYGENGRYLLHQRGGSVYIDAHYTLDFDHYIISGGLFSAKNCWFVNNTAMLGGAIYNSMGKCELKSCVFDGNKAIQEDRSETVSTYNYQVNNWGGAIMTETSVGLYYNDSTDRLRIASSNYTYNSNNNVTTIDLFFYKLQNTLLLEKETITANNLELYDYTSKTKIPINSVDIITQTNQPTLSDKYQIKITGQLSMSHKLYFKFIGNSANPSLISHLVTVNDGVIT